MPNVGDMRRFLMRLECVFIFEHFIEEKFGRFVFRLVDQECLNTWIILRFRHEFPQNPGDRLGLLRFRLPESSHDKAISKSLIINHGPISAKRHALT